MNSLKINPKQVVEEARRWIGTPYHHQASLHGVGCDCLGLLRGVRRALGGEDPKYIPPYTPRGEISGEDLDSALALYFKRCNTLVYEPGNILVFRWRDHLPPGHVAIVSAQEKKGYWMIHAHAGISVAEVPIDSWWRRHLLTVFAFSLE